ncbi:MAG: hypothetical protein RLZZ114_1093 [Bacteroidota bacterium]
MRTMKWVIFWAVCAVWTAGHAGGQTVATPPLPNLFIGTGGHGHTHPSAQRPFGMVQLGPDTRLEGWDGCSGYHHTDTALYGFSHTHLSGTGVSDYGDLLVVPQSGALDLRYQPLPFQHASTGDPLAEIAVPGYYSVGLPGGVRAELTSTERVGRHRYWADPSRPFRVLIRMNHRDKAYDFAVRPVAGAGVSAAAASGAAGRSSAASTAAASSAAGVFRAEGHRFSRAWATRQKLFFALNASVPFVLTEPEPGLFVLEFAAGSWSKTGHLDLDMALSSTDTEGAWRNWTAETRREPTFNDTRRAAALDWERELGKIEVQGPSDQVVVFRTALYHAFSVPNLWSDVDGRYRGMDDAVHQDTLNQRYTVFSLWDTYRTAHPLYALTQPERTNDFVATMLDHYVLIGRLPVWELAANETNCMIGYHAVSVLADAYAKGYPVPLRAALRAADSTAKAAVFGLPTYRTQGYLSVEDAPESVSKTLEYAYDDWCIARLAEAAGRPDLRAEYDRRATGYRSVLDPETGLVRPRTNGGWLTPFEPREVNNHFTEANAWQYSFAPVHDLAGWTAQLGNGDRRAGLNRLEMLLDGLFSAPSATVGREQADITGLVGQYAHGNEPSHHIAYLYNATPNPWKGQRVVRHVLDSLYRNAPDGLSGNEDCGQMSAWYVMASLGLYPLVPGESRYATGALYWNRAVLHLPDALPGVVPDGLPKKGGSGAQAHVARGIRTPLPAHRTVEFQRAGDGPYVARMRFNGRPVGGWLDHQALVQGGVLEFEQQEQPVEREDWEPYANGIGSAAGAAPAPTLRVARSFADKTELRMDPPAGVESGILRVTLHVTEKQTLDVSFRGKDVFWPQQKGSGTADALVLTQTTRIEAALVQPNGAVGHTAVATATRWPNTYRVAYSSAPNRQYTGGSDNALVDGISGDVEWRKGNWVGHQGVDLVVRVDLGSKQRVDRVSVGLLKDIGAWIAFPQGVAVWASNAEVDPTTLASQDFETVSKSVRSAWSWSTDLRATAKTDESPLTNTVTFDAPQPKKARFLYLKFTNAGPLPEWHPGAGGQTFFFVDEVSVRTK